MWSVVQISVNLTYLWLCFVNLEHACFFFFALDDIIWRSKMDQSVFRSHEDLTNKRFHSNLNEITCTDFIMFKTLPFMGYNLQF